MPARWKVKKMVDAAERFHTTTFLVDVVAMALFASICISIANKVLNSVLFQWEFLNLSWNTIGILGFGFLVLLVIQIQGIRKHRTLSDFELEAALKATKNGVIRRRKKK